MGDPPPSGSWRLDWRDYQGRHVGNARPPASHKRFKTREAALRELARLSAVPGTDIRGFVSAAPSKPLPMEQTDFGFVPNGMRRMTV
jgi:hypothetical protein